MRKITLFAVSLSFALFLSSGVMPGQAAAGDDHIVKVACSTYDGRVIGADTTSEPDETPLLECGPCNPGNQCVQCLASLIENGCEFDEDMKVRYLDKTGSQIFMQGGGGGGEPCGEVMCGQCRGPECDECCEETGSAVLYQLIDEDGDCIEDVCEENDPR